MTAPNNPAVTSTSLEAPPIPLPAPSPADARRAEAHDSPEHLAAEVARLDRLLVAGVLLLAFFLGSFAATNSDLWQHLAAGRLVAHGQYPFGSDPFAYTTQGAYWANHAWLSDLIAYGVAQIFDGPDTATAGVALVLLKAALVVLTA